MKNGLKHIKSYLITYMEKQTKRLPKLFLLLLIILVVLVVLNVSLGSTNVSLIDYFKNFNNPDSSEYIIVRFLRMPRILACILVGAALSVAGLLLQTMMNNSLAAPGIIGINSGAGLAVVLSSLLIDASTFELSIFTFIGAFVASIMIYFLGLVTGASRNKLILAGVALSRLFTAISDAICFFVPTALSNRVIFSLGSFSNLTTSKLIFSSIIIVIGLIATLLISRYLNILILGDEVAQSLGLNIKVIRFLLLIIISILCAGSVSLVGLLSFLGLIVPHIVRRLIGIEDHKRLVKITMIFGADLTLLCDLLARTLFIPFEIPVGIIMTLIGVPFFVYLLFDKGGRSRIVKD